MGYVLRGIKRVPNTLRQSFRHKETKYGPRKGTKPAGRIDVIKGGR